MRSISFPFLCEANTKVTEEVSIILDTQDATRYNIQKCQVFAVQRNPSIYSDEAEETD